MQLIPQFKYNPLVTRWKMLKLAITLIFLTLIIIGIVLTLSSDMKVQYAFFALYGEGVVLSIVLYVLAICIRDIFYRKTIRINQVLSTKLDIQTSAFKDI